jgi:CRISPR system Cascade subunit CasE
MFLHKLVINLRSRDARRDVADPYAMHSTLCRAFVPEDTPMPPGAVLWRLETPDRQMAKPILLVQSSESLPPDWSRLPAGWLTDSPILPPLNLAECLGLDSLRPGTVFRFCLRANPSKCVQKKRLGLLHRPEQEQWLRRVGKELGGFSVPKLASFFGDAEPSGLDVRISEETMLTGRKHNGSDRDIRIFSALFEGLLTVESPGMFRSALANGIGHGKAMGLGLLSLAPVRPGSAGGGA